MTIFCIDVQEHHVTPVIQIIQASTHFAKRVIDDRVDIALQAVRRFSGIGNQRPLELILPQLFIQRRVFCSQCRNWIRLRHRGARDTRGEDQQQALNQLNGLDQKRLCITTPSLLNQGFEYSSERHITANIRVCGQPIP